MVRVLNNAELEAQRMDRSPASAPPPLMLVSALGGHIRRHWEINKAHKRSIEDGMLEDLRQTIGEYDPLTLASIREFGGSEIFMMLTATKVRAAASWITDILLPAGDKAWSIEATPVPDLAPEMSQFVERMVQASAAKLQGQGVEVSDEDIDQRRQEARQRIREAMEKQAADAARNMEKRIEDQFAEGNYNGSLLEFIDDFCTYPAAILKGPVYRRRRALKWGPQGEPVVGYEIRSEDERVSPFDVYPSPGAITPNDGTFIERMRLQRSDLYEMMGVPGYDSSAIQAVLMEAGQGRHYGTLSTNDAQRNRYERGSDTYTAEDGLIDALHFWGSAPGWMLLEWGMPPDQVEDPFEEVEIEAILIGHRVIRVAKNTDPLRRRPYYKACFHAKPGSFWGLSIPYLMRDIQRMCNATARALANNMGMASGPQVMVMNDLLAPGESAVRIYPWRLWQMSSHPTASGNVQPVQFFQPQSNAAELLGVFEKFEQKADDATNVPRYAYGNERVAGAGATAQGLAMLLESASKGIKHAVRNIDHGVIEPRVTRQYHDNMLYERDPSIKGDLRIVARGSGVLVTKAATQARRNEFLAITGNEIDLGIMGTDGRADLLRDMAADMDLPRGIIPSEAEMEAKAQARAKEGPPPDPRTELEKLRAANAMEIEKIRQMNNERDRALKLAIAEFEQKTAMLKLAAERELSLEQIKAQLGETALRERGASQRLQDEARIKAQFGSGI